MELEDRLSDIKKTIRILEVLSDPKSEDSLTPREKLALRAFEISDLEVEAALDFLDRLEDIADAAVIAAHRDEVGIPLDDFLKELGYTREELIETAKAEDSAQ